MNKARRTRINEIIEKLNALKEDVEAIMDEEQESFDNMPESLQEGERGDAMQEAIDNLSSAMYFIGEAVDSLDEASI